MNEKELMVTMPLDRFEELLSTEVRADFLAEQVKESKYMIEREKIATILGFKLSTESNEERGHFNA